MRAALALGRQGAGRCAPQPRRRLPAGRGRPADRPARAPPTAAAPMPRPPPSPPPVRPRAARRPTSPSSPAPISAAAPPAPTHWSRRGSPRAVVAIPDPDPRTSGAGLARLRAAGIAVATGIRAAEAAADHAPFLTRILHGRPRVTLKLAASLDGRIATARRREPLDHRPGGAPTRPRAAPAQRCGHGRRRHPRAPTTPTSPRAGWAPWRSPCASCSLARTRRASCLPPRGAPPARRPS